MWNISLKNSLWIIYNFIILNLGILCNKDIVNSTLTLILFLSVIMEGNTAVSCFCCFWYVIGNLYHFSIYAFTFVSVEVARYNNGAIFLKLLKIIKNRTAGRKPGLWVPERHWTNYTWEELAQRASWDRHNFNRCWWNTFCRGQDPPAKRAGSPAG